MKDKPWITTALKKSSRVKNRLYKRWAQFRLGWKMMKWHYKHYKRHYRISEEAERLYYQDLFNTKENSTKKLWNNLNTICSFKKKNNKFNITLSRSIVRTAISWSLPTMWPLKYCKLCRLIRWRSLCCMMLSTYTCSRWIRFSLKVILTTETAASFVTRLLANGLPVGTRHFTTTLDSCRSGT